MTEATTLPRKDMSQRFFRRRPDDTLPLTVEHQRIYIIPSKRGFAFLFALLVCLIASINYQLNLGYGLCFLLTGLFWASLLHTYKNLAGVTLEAVHAHSVSCGEDAKFIVRLSNKGPHDRIGIDIKYGENGDKWTRTDIPTDSITTITLPITTHKRGYLSLGRLTLTSQYPISLWTTWSYCHTPSVVVVHPKAELNPPPLPRAFLDGEAESSQLSGEGDVASLRDYIPGDPLTRIAWKRAARSGGTSGLHVRELEQNMTGGDIELSLNTTDIHGIEAQMSRLAAWVNAATQTGTSYSLTLANEHIKNNTGDAHRLACMDALGTYKASSQGTSS